MAEIITDLEITSLTHGGRGIGRHEGKAVFVGMTAPADIISCRIKKSKKNFIEAELYDFASQAVSLYLVFSVLSTFHD